MDAGCSDITMPSSSQRTPKSGPVRMDVGTLDVPETHGKEEGSQVRTKR